MNNKKALQIIEARIIAELLYHLNENEDGISFGALVDEADDDTTIADLLYSAEYLRSKVS